MLFCCSMQKRVAEILILVLLLATALSSFFLVYPRPANQPDHSVRAGPEHTVVPDRQTRWPQSASLSRATSRPGRPTVRGSPEPQRLPRSSPRTSGISGPRVQSARGIESLDALVASCDALVDADNRIRQNLRLGQTLMAADVLFSDSRNILDVTTTHLVRCATRSRPRTDRSVWH
jgi:hypothetical protein